MELQQRAIEYIQLSTVASTDVLATVLEEMPPFPERESSILAKLKKKRPATKDVPEHKDPKPITLAAHTNSVKKIEVRTTSFLWILQSLQICFLVEFNLKTVRSPHRALRVHLSLLTLLKKLAKYI